MTWATILGAMRSCAQQTGGDRPRRFTPDAGDDFMPDVGG